MKDVKHNVNLAILEVDYILELLKQRRQKMRGTNEKDLNVSITEKLSKVQNEYMARALEEILKDE